MDTAIPVVNVQTEPPHVQLPVVVIEICVRHDAVLRSPTARIPYAGAALIVAEDFALCLVPVREDVLIAPLVATFSERSSSRTRSYDPAVNPAAADLLCRTEPSADP